MADPWRIAGMTWSLTAIGWLLSPIFVFLVNKFFSYLSVDISRKLRELEIHTIPTLKQTLSRATEQKVLKAADDGRCGSDLKILDVLTKDLRSALYEAEDILDLIDYHKIEKEVIGGCQLGAEISAFIGHCASWFGRCIDSIVECAQRWYRRIAEMILQWRGASPPLPISGETSISRVQRLRGWCRRLDISNYCQSIRSWLANAYTVARSCRDWSYEVVGIEVNKKDGIGLDFPLLTIDGKSLRKRIEDIEHIAIDSKKSDLLLNQQSSSNELSDKDTDKESRSKQKDFDHQHRGIKGKVFGREKERERICSMLRKGPDASRPPSRPYSVVGIHGVSGYGKSTLAQYVCDHEKEHEDKYFDHIIFIQVSKTFQLDDIIRDMLKQMPQDQPSQHQPSDTNGCETPCDKLKKKLKGRRFLLVLDDLWVNEDNEKERRILLRTLDAGESGSGILVTAQREEAVIALGAQEPIKISDLEADEYFSMFMHYAGKSVDSKYGRIGREIAEKLRKSPLAAETVARRLGMNPDIEFWRTTANLDVLNKTIGALWWSYRQLGADIRRCFEYCRTFPRGHKLNPNDLVRMWIAQGFVNTSNATEDMEDIGQSYIHELRNCSFLQVERTSYLTIHDMLHKLAETIAGSDSCSIDVNGSPKDIPPDVRHLFIETYNRAEITEKILELENLRTLIIEEKYRPNEDMFDIRRWDVEETHDLIKEKVFEGMFKKLRKLRVLKVQVKCNSSLVFSVPESIGQMKHLRYLGFRSNPHLFVHLVFPSTLSKLYYMQMLDVPSCRLSRAEGLSNLTHLRQIPGDIPSIGNLTSLHTISFFRTRKEPAGYELKQLKHLNKLRGILRIKGLETVESKEEALEANVSGKKLITTLELYFGNVAEEKKVVQSQVLEGLCPPNQLEELSISFYHGNGYPSWMLGGHHSGLNNIHRLTLNGCSQLESIPEGSAFFQRLRSFRLFHCGWDALPDHLERLTSLRKLVIIDCPNIKVLPTLPQSLKHIRLIHAGDDLGRFCKQKWQLENITTVMDIWL